MFTILVLMLVEVWLHLNDTLGISINNGDAILKFLLNSPLCGQTSGSAHQNSSSCFVASIQSREPYSIMKIEERVTTNQRTLTKATKPQLQKLIAISPALELELSIYLYGCIQTARHFLCISHFICSSSSYKAFSLFWTT